jgi:subtilisin family serine protease
MVPLLLQVGLTQLMRLTAGRREVVVGLLDGPVAADHPELASDSIRFASAWGRCAQADSRACRHGTFVAGILAARRGGLAPGICPDCTLWVRPVFTEAISEAQPLPSAKPQALAEAIRESVEAGAWIINLSAGMSAPSTRAEHDLHDALDLAARHGALVVAAAGNQGTLGSSAITRHPWVLPVVGYGVNGLPTAHTNLGSSMGRRGLGAPGENVTSLSPRGQPLTLSGTSFAAAFVTGAIALLWSQFPFASPTEIKNVVTRFPRRQRTSVTPPLLDAWGAHQVLSAAYSTGVLA